MCSMSGTELRGNTVICPGDRGVFECQTTNTLQLFWIVDGTPLSIPITHTVNSGSIEASGHVACLVNRSLASGNVGNRTSLLRVAPVTTNISTVVCSGGDPVNTCSRNINFVGNTIPLGSSCGRVSSMCIAGMRKGFWSSFFLQRLHMNNSQERYYY